MTADDFGGRFEEWRDAPSRDVFVTVDHTPAHADDRHPIGIGDENHVVWLTLDDAKWLKRALSEAVLAASGVVGRIEKARGGAG